MHVRVFDEAAPGRVPVWSGNVCRIPHQATDGGRADQPPYRFDQTMNRHELAVSGIGADTWSVSTIDTDGVTRLYADKGGAGFTASDRVVVQDVRAEVIILTFSGGTGAPNRKVTLHSSSRDLST